MNVRRRHGRRGGWPEESSADCEMAGPAAALNQGIAQRAKVSPVQKVVELLDNLKSKCVADITAEEKEMQAYLSYCDEEASNKAYALKTAAREQADLQAGMEKASRRGPPGNVPHVGLAIVVGDPPVRRVGPVGNEVRNASTTVGRRACTLGAYTVGLLLRLQPCMRAWPS